MSDFQTERTKSDSTSNQKIDRKSLHANCDYKRRHDRIGLKIMIPIAMRRIHPFSRKDVNLN